MNAGADADGQAQSQPDHKGNGPEHQETNAVGQHGGGDGTDTGFFVVALGEGDDNSKVRHQGRNDIGAGITDAVRQLAQLRPVTQQHKHGNEYRGENVPLGGSGAHKQVHKGREQDKDHNQGNQADIGVLEEGSAAEGDDGAQFGIVEVFDKLSGDERQGQERAHGGHGFAHGVADGVVVGKGAHGAAKGHAGQEKQQGDENHNAVHKGGRLAQQLTGLLIKQT